MLTRSDEPVARHVRTVFGLHTIDAFVYSPGPKQKIALRPVDARLQLPAGRASYLFKEFSQFFCVDQVFGAAQPGINLTLKQTVSVNSLEEINQRLGGQAESYLKQLPTPVADEEAELLVFTGDGKGVPMVQEDAAKLLLRQMATKRKLNGQAKKDVATVCGYFQKNAARMRYDKYLREGYQIASGVIEGACRHFVKDRMERSGMRWCLDGAQAMLNVRAIYLSSNWDEFQTWRIVNEQQQMHPHRKLIQNYSPVTIGA